VVVVAGTGVGVEVEAASVVAISGALGSCVIPPIDSPFINPGLVHPLAAVVVVATGGGMVGRGTEVSMVGLLSGKSASDADVSFFASGGVVVMRNIEVYAIEACQNTLWETTMMGTHVGGRQGRTIP
jgi:hypothetical protein